MLPSARSRASLLLWIMTGVLSFQFALAFVRTLAAPSTMAQLTPWLTDYPFRRRVLMLKILSVLGKLPFHYRSANSQFSALTLFELLFAFVAMTAAVAASRRWIQHLLGAESLWQWASLLVVFASNNQFLLVSDIRVATPYDLPSMAIFGWASYAAFTRNRWLFYPLLIVGTLNRESTLFLPLVFLLFGIVSNRRSWKFMFEVRPYQLIECAGQLVLWAAILRWCIAISGGPGRSVNLLHRNLYMILNPIHWATFLSILGFLWIPYVLWFDKLGVRMQRLAWLSIPWSAVMFKYADPLEIRTNAEWTVYTVTAVAIIAAALFQEHTTETVHMVQASLTSVLAHDGNAS